ncbi:phage RecT family recombinase [Peteryoungia aggregata LMG 23059]|uniref:Phage RecT family recombinase n=1 Tax=Peteryoungia aggregata LMG 23059 TaxID=1368425 RepID=A0ABU0GCK5_9HYPH|nr:recombinase RecT [Peteryoungia aggregata]MDQ0422365.1 phage RecT family recombinase [Peteryoungia aggregata LMG 23059]
MSNQLTVNAATMFEQFRPDLLPIMAETGQSFDRLKSTFSIAVQQNPDILKCTPESLRREISKCAVDGLVPDSKEAVLLPYLDNKSKEYIANYQPMVYGIIKRMKELGGVFQIVCNLVYKTDLFSMNEADPDSLAHKQADPFGTDRGDVVGGYVIFRDEHKRLMHFEKMSREDFDRVRAASKAPDSPAWKHWFEEMCKKAVLRRGAKYISINNDKIRALIERQDTMFDFQEKPKAERVDPFSGATIDGTVVDAAPASRTQQAGSGASEKTAPAKKELAEKPPEFPSDLDLLPGDIDSLKEATEKVLKIALDKKLDAPGRRGVLKGMPETWKPVLPEYLHPLLKTMIDVTDWAILRDAAGLPWAGEHAMFVHKMKELLGVEKLNIGKYP